MPSIYDVAGKRVSATTRKQRRLFYGTFPPGRYISQPLSEQCSSIEEVQRFLSKCRYISDEKQFGKRDYWIPPEEFEEGKKGDCEDFALWTWRQLMGMGYKARYVIGRSGKYGAGHAWVTIEKEGKHFIVEPLAWYVGETLPRLSVMRYEPEGSIEWDGQNLHYFVHKKLESGVPVFEFVILAGEWLLFWIRFWLRFACRMCLFPFFLLRKLFREKVSFARTSQD